MMNSSKALLLIISASGLLLMPCGIAQAAYLPQSSLPDAITSVYNTHFTHTSHPKETLLSSAFYSLPENSGNSLSYSLSKNLGSSLSYSLSKNLGSSLFYPLPKDLGRGWEGFHNTTLIQLAATCFVTDTSACSGNEFAGNNADDDGHGAPGGPGDGDDYDLDNAERCRQEGYTQTSCPEGQEPSNTCPYDSSYFEKCVSSCPSNYVTCEKPYYGVGEACDGKYASCECTPCGSGYDNTTIPEGYVQDGEACLDCDGKTKYKIKPNPCDGYMDCGSMGGEAGAKTCLSGTTTMYDNCKACPNLGEYTTCPSCTICQYEECSGLWYATGCATNCTDYCDFCGG